jgi:signal transduction histidine kinase
MTSEHDVDNLVMTDEIRHRLSVAARCRPIRGFIHDFCYGIQSIAGMAEILRLKHFTEDANPAAYRIVQNIERSCLRQAEGQQVLVRLWERRGRGMIVEHLKRTVAEWFGYNLRRSRTILECRWPEEDVVDDGAGGVGRIFFHVLSNALTAAQLGGDERRIDVAADLQTDRFVVDVSDSGPGIDRRVMDSLFDLGVSAWRDSDPDYAGLGLYLAKAEGAEIGATIAVTSPRSPTTFRIVLPVQR